jgi:16S rRNA (cytidine1402-2'-O)-methyltransferase
MAGRLYLVPNALGPGAIETVLPASVASLAARLDYFVGENAKSTRAFLKRVGEINPLARPIREIDIVELHVSTPADALPAMLAPIIAGRDGGLVSEAGCPAVADPGAALVRLAHDRAIEVCPLVGPSSILLALMASGLDGQRFAFNGYLPTDPLARIEAVREAERRSSRLRQTQIFIETPYRNATLLEALCATCKPNTLLCVAVDLTLDTQSIVTKTIDRWTARTLALDKRPAIFLLLGKH